jgi:hypothetical protein
MHEQEQDSADSYSSSCFSMLNRSRIWIRLTLEDY